MGKTQPSAKAMHKIGLHYTGPSGVALQTPTLLISREKLMNDSLKDFWKR